MSFLCYLTVVVIIVFLLSSELLTNRQNYGVNNMSYQQQSQLAGVYNGANYKQSPPLPPPVRFPPPQPLYTPTGLTVQPQQAPAMDQHPRQLQQQQQYFRPEQPVPQEPEMSASRMRYGQFIQRLDEERRQRSVSLTGMNPPQQPPPPQVQPPSFQVCQSFIPVIILINIPFVFSAKFHA